jgi:hypothetical protein
MTISSIAPSVSPSVVDTQSSSIDIAVLAKSLDLFSQSGESMVQMMEQSVNPAVGANFDQKV